jgi:hypothetical protein
MAPTSTWSRLPRTRTGLLSPVTMPSEHSERIACARAVPIADEIHRRRLSLRQVGLELVGACPGGCGKRRRG